MDPLNYRPISLLPIINKVMESIIGVDMKSFLFSNYLISDHQFGFRPGHSALHMLLLFSQQWMEIISQLSPLTYLVLPIKPVIPPCSQNSLPLMSKANSTHGFLTSSCLVANVWLSTASFLPLCLSKLECSKAVLSAPVLLLIFINNLSDSLENPLYLFADNSTPCRDIPHPSDRQATASSLSSDLEKTSQTGQTLGICLSILTNLTISLFLSPKRPFGKPHSLLS